MRKINLILPVGFLLTLAVIGVFYLYVGNGHSISTNAGAWGVFGDYFGGVAGTLLSFISIIMLAYTVHIQNEQLSNSHHEILKRDLLAHLTKADDEIEHWLLRKLPYQRRDSDAIEFGDVVWGLYDSTLVSDKEFKVAAERLLQLTCLYCQALALYEDNINAHFIYKHHHQKAQSLVKFLCKHQNVLNQMAGISLEFCQMHLNGNNSSA